MIEVLSSDHCINFNIKRVRLLRALRDLSTGGGVAVVFGRWRRRADVQ